MVYTMIKNHDIRPSDKVQPPGARTTYFIVRYSLLINLDTTAHFLTTYQIILVIQLQYK